MGLDLAFDDADHHLRACPFAAFPFGGKTLGLRRSIATLAVVTGQFLANSALAEPDGSRDLALGPSCSIHIGDHFTVFRTEAAVFTTHSQFVIKPDWMNPLLCQPIFYLLTI